MTTAAALKMETKKENRKVTELRVVASEKTKKELAFDYNMYMLFNNYGIKNNLLVK